jgi:hypothetical protein
LLEALILSKENRLQDYVQALNTIISKASDATIKKTAADLLSLLNKSKLPQIDLSKDTTRRDSLNALYKNQVVEPVGPNAAKPDSTELTELGKLNAAKMAAIKSGKLKVDTTQPVAALAAKDAAGKAGAGGQAALDSASVVQEDTTSPYKRADNAIHYFIFYIKDPAVTQNAIASVRAKIDAFNSLQFPDKRLEIKAAMIDKNNRLLHVRQFKNAADAVAYFNVIKTQSQLFNDLKPAQYSIVVMSTDNYHMLVDTKDIDAYNKFFYRVYKGAKK